MAKALFLSLPLTGHINPSLPLVRELAERGDDVVYYATGVFAKRIGEAKACYKPYRNAFLADLKAAPRADPRTSRSAHPNGRGSARRASEEFRQERPDYVITDSVAPWRRLDHADPGASGGDLDLHVRLQPSCLEVAVANGIRPKSAGQFVAKLRNLSRAILREREFPDVMGFAAPESRSWSPAVRI